MQIFVTLLVICCAAVDRNERGTGSGHLLQKDVYLAVSR